VPPTASRPTRPAASSRPPRTGHQPRSPRRAPSRRALAVTTGIVAAVVTVLTVLALRSPEAATPAAPRARVYRDVDVCLLTDAQGLAGDPARLAWQGLQSLSRTGTARVSYVSVPAPGTPDVAAPILNGLVQRRCTVVVAAGTAQTAAVDAVAGTASGTRFVNLTAGPAHAGVTALDPAAPHLDTALAAAVRTIVGG